MTRTGKFRWMALPIALASLLGGSPAPADVVTDWNVIADDITVAAGQPPPAANRTLAMVQTAVYEAVNAITKRYPADRLTLSAIPDASVHAAVATANRAVLLRLVPTQQAAIDNAHGSTLAAIAEGTAKTAGVAAGENRQLPRCSRGARTTGRERLNAIGRPRPPAHMFPRPSPPLPSGRSANPG